MENEDKKLLQLALKALEDGVLTKNDRFAFSRDHRRYANGELTFRELMEAIKSPSDELKEAMEKYYGRSNYRRSFK